MSREDEHRVLRAHVNALARCAFGDVVEVLTMNGDRWSAGVRRTFDSGAAAFVLREFGATERDALVAAGSQLAVMLRVQANRLARELHGWEAIK